jgi:hypothetical protein
MSKIFVYVSKNKDGIYDDDSEDIPIGDFDSFDEAYKYVLNDLCVNIMCEETGKWWDDEEERWYRPEANDEIWDNDNPYVLLPYSDTKNKELFEIEGRFIIDIGRGTYYIITQKQT